MKIANLVIGALENWSAGFEIGIDEIGENVRRWFELMDGSSEYRYGNFWHNLANYPHLWQNQPWMEEVRSPNGLVRSWELKNHYTGKRKVHIQGSCNYEAYTMEGDPLVGFTKGDNREINYFPKDMKKCQMLDLAQNRGFVFFIDMDDEPCIGYTWDWDIHAEQDYD